MAQPSNARERLVAEWQKAYSEACSGTCAPGTQAAWMARLKQRLYWFLLSLYGRGEWNRPRAIDGPKVSAAVIADESVRLEGKPAKSIGTIRAALESVSGSCEATPEVGPLAAGEGIDAWVVVASSGSGIDAYKCGACLEGQGIIARIVPSASETTVSVRLIHESIARRLVAENHTRFELPEVAPPPKRQGNLSFRGARQLIDYVAWVLIMAPAGALILWQNLVAFWPDIPAPPYELNIAVALFVCVFLLFMLFMRSLVWLDSSKR